MPNTMKSKHWKIVYYIGIILIVIGFSMSLYINFKHWDEILSRKEEFFLQLPAVSVIVPGWLIMALGIFKR